MARSNTRYGAYDISLEEEINRVLSTIIKLGIKNPTKIEVTALIAEATKKSKITTIEIKDFFRRIRGL